MAGAVRKKGENAVRRYLFETRSEIKKVIWPKREQALNLTLIVIAVTLGMSAFLGILDLVFTKIFGLMF